ncbi:MAG: TfoX/Sxy family protein [Bacteroidota bacterium]
MAYDEWLAERISNLLLGRCVSFHDKKMRGGLCLMVDDKMCIGIVKDTLMARIAPQVYEDALKKEGVREMDFTGRPFKGYVFVSPEALGREEELAYWVDACLAFTPLVKSSKKKKKTHQ